MALTPASSSGGDDPVTITGTVTVDGSAVTQPVSAVELPLPDGAATDASLTDGLMRGTMDRAWLLNRELDSIDVGVVEVAQGAAPWRVDGSGVVQPVSVGNFPASQPVTVAALPLPSGAMADATGQAMAAALNEIAFQAILAGERSMFT